MIGDDFLRRFLIIFLCVALGASITSGVALASDTPSPWAVEFVEAAVAEGLVPQSLRSNYTRATTRAEFCSLAVYLYEKVTNTEITGRMTFNDTDDINVQKMGSIGVVTGVGNGNFAPDRPLTREQAAAMITRLANALDQPLGSHTATFTDFDNVADYARDAVGQMQLSGIMTGVGDNRFNPRGNYTREQSITTIVRLFRIINQHIDTSYAVEDSNEYDYGDDLADLW
jgi:hypothetical protein